MKGLSLYSKILKNVWLIDKVEAEAYYPAIIQLLTGQQVSLYEQDDKKESSLYALSPYPVTRYGSLSDAPNGSVAILNVEDVIDKDDNCGVPGTKTLTNQLNAALDSDNIIGVVLNMDTPGGSPYGTESFSQAIDMATKPVVAYVDGRAASAGYWIASATAHIMLSSTISRVGSIGTYATIRDYTEYYKEAGIKIWEVYASASTQKNEAVRNILEKGDTTVMRQREIDPINEAFMDQVKSARGSKLDLSANNVLAGAMYTGQEAINVGLADSIGTLLDAVQKVEDLSHNSFFQSLNKSNNMFNSQSKLKGLNALVEKCSKGEAFSPEDMSAANEEIVTAGADSIQLVTSKMLDFDAKRMKKMNATLQSAVTLLSAETETDVESFDVAGAITSLQAANAALTAEKAALQAKLDDKGEDPQNTQNDGQQDFSEEEEKPLSAEEKTRKEISNRMGFAHNLMK